MYDDAACRTDQSTSVILQRGRFGSCDLLELNYPYEVKAVCSIDDRSWQQTSCVSACVACRHLEAQTSSWLVPIAPEYRLVLFCQGVYSRTCSWKENLEWYLDQSSSLCDHYPPASSQPHPPALSNHGTQPRAMQKICPVCITHGAMAVQDHILVYVYNKSHRLVFGILDLYKVSPQLRWCSVLSQLIKRQRPTGM